MKAECECTNRFTCRYCLDNRKPWIWTPSTLAEHQAYLDKVYASVSPERRQAAYEADQYHASQPNT